MSDVVFVTITTAASTLVAALGGTYLANRHTRLLARAARRAALDDEARRLVVEVITAATLWSNSAQAFGIALSASGSFHAAQAFMTTNPTDGVVNDMAAEAKSLSRALTSATLLIPQSDLLASLVSLRRKTDSFGNDVTQPVLEGLKGADAASAPHLFMVLEYANSYRSQVHGLEQAAALHFLKQSA